MPLTERKTSDWSNTVPRDRKSDGRPEALNVPHSGGDILGALGRSVRLSVRRVAFVVGLVCIGLVVLAGVSPWFAVIAWPLALLVLFWRVIFNGEEIEPRSYNAREGAPVAAFEFTSPVSGPAPERSPEPTWRAIIDSSTDPIMLIDRDGYVVHFNPPLADLFDKVRPGVALTNLTRSPALLDALGSLAPDDRQRVVQIEDRIPVLRKLSAIITPVQTFEDAGLKLVVLRDLTAEQKHAQLRSDFISHASHELRTPLASLKSMVETLQGPARNDEAGRDRFLSMMQQQAARMSRLIDDLLVLSRAEMRVHLAPTDRVDLAELILSCAEQLRPLAEARDNTIELEGLGAPIVVRGDRDDLFQIFQNLLQNAIKYGHDGEVITVSARTVAMPGRNSGVEISVHDRGDGISAEHLPRVTERFYRVSATASRDKGGTGLGLAIVKYLVNRHRGQLNVTSEIGQGSTFQVTLELADGS